MNPEIMDKLRLDRRLHTRRDWISKEDLEKELAALPDVSEKIDKSDPDRAGSGKGTGDTSES